MPNWCAGTLRVRGKKKDLQNFIMDDMEPSCGYGKEPVEIKLDEYGNIYCNRSCYIKGTNRGFVKSLDVYLEDYEDDFITTIALDAEFAWGISSEELLELCRKYHLDMAIYAFERGMEFNQIIEIINGKILKDAELNFDDYVWECICPNMGG